MIRCRPNGSQLRIHCRCKCRLFTETHSVFNRIKDYHAEGRFTWASHPSPMLWDTSPVRRGTYGAPGLSWGRIHAEVAAQHRGRAMIRATHRVAPTHSLLIQCRLHAVDSIAFSTDQRLSILKGHLYGRLSPLPQLPWDTSTVSAGFSRGRRAGGGVKNPFASCAASKDEHGTRQTYKVAPTIFAYIHAPMRCCISLCTLCTR